ncbi:unnamed protein product [Brachionus calyciflorus]|uniref:ATP-dependent DNA helicase n=1 Tax=Brachionus calyciflorus TaxID=104777 RepID=A0A814E1Y3_9BILA|nr:unnamed protein product [Brachionus calyciflorus]
MLFKENESIEKIKNLVNNTELTAYFQLNNELNKTDETIIGRMYFIQPNDIERFALRILLIYKKRAESFEDLRTGNGIIYSSFFEAAQKSGQLESDSQWTDSLEEACLKIIDIDELRKFFVIVLENCMPSDRHVKKEKILFFVDGPGGKGKTFLYNTLISYIRSQNKKVLSVASSGIAALLLAGGKTAHSRFKIPLNLNHTNF